MDLDWIAVSDLISKGLSHQVTQFTIAFGVAAYIHAGRVKKEIASQMSGITGAINSLADALKKELSEHSARIEKLTSRVDSLEKEK